MDPIRAGGVTVNGATPGAIAPRANPPRAGYGVGRPQGRRTRAGRSIADNVTYSRLAPYSTLGFLNLRRRRAAVRDWLERLQVKAHSTEQEVDALSGGNQQKIALARILHQDADVLLLDEPTRGIDVGTKAEIYRLMGELAAAGQGDYLCQLLPSRADGRLRPDWRDGPREAPPHSADRPVDGRGSHGLRHRALRTLESRLG